MLYFLILIAAIGGSLTALQAKLNARLGQMLEHPIQAAFISFVGGLLTICFVLLVIRPPLPLKSSLADIPWWTYIGGLLGATFVTAIILLVPKIGLTRVLVAAIAGQLIMGVLIDHFGWLHTTPDPITLSRGIGLASLALGVVLVSAR